MSQKKGNLTDCMAMSIHHLEDSTISLMLSVATTEQCRYRMALVRSEVETALNQVRKIKEIAEKEGLDDVLAIINEDVEFGHDLD